MRPFDPTKVPKPSATIPFDICRAFSAIDLEIGSGVGRFAVQRAKDHRDRAIIAIEKTIERFGKFKRRAANHPGLTNLFPVHGEAASVVTHFIPPESIDQIFLLYPNPYPKLKQRNLRWHNRAFTGFLIDRLKPGGTLTLATNIEDYYDEALEAFSRVWHLDVVEHRKLTRFDEPRTHFEHKYMARDEDCWNLIFKKP